MSLGWSLAAVPFLIGLNAFLVVSEYAVVATKPVQLEALRARGWRRAAGAMAGLQADPAGTIGAIQVCITMTNLLLGWIGEPAMSAVLERLFGAVIAVWPGFTVVSTALSFIVVTLLTVVFSELLPKALTLRYVLPAAALTAVPVAALRVATGPLVWVMTRTANAVTRPLGLGRVEDFEKQQVTVDELRLLAMQAAEDGAVTPRERSLILNSLTVGRRRTKEIMVHRTRVEWFDLNASMDENMRVMDEHLYSRLPVCDGGLDDVVGVVSAKEFLTAYHAKGETPILRLIARPPVFVPELATLDQLLTLIHEKRAEMLFVVDEHGGVEGIVTLQDVVDELLGEGVEGEVKPQVNADVCR